MMINPNNDGGVSAHVHSGNVGSRPADGGQGNKWLDFFGPPSSAVNDAPYDKYRYTTYDLPEAYKGRNLFLRDTLDGLITGDTSQHTWYTSPACLPYRETDQIHLSWNVWQFNRTLAGQVPHEGISRLITSSKRSFKESTVRYGLAFYLEHGFMNTAEGRQQYQRNLMGIKQCVQEANNYDVLATILHSPRYDREYLVKHGEYNRPMGEILRREVAEWAVVQKSGSGLDWLVEEYKEHLMRNGGVSPSVFIIPPKMALFMTMADPVKTQYMYAGEDGTRMLKEGPSALTTFRGVNVFKSHSFDVYQDELPIDLLRRDMQIGEFYVMRDTLSTHKGGHYNSMMRDIIIYDESIDDWKRIKFDEAIEQCPRFDETGNLAPADNKEDFFTFKPRDGVEHRNVEYWGQVKSTFLDYNILTDVADHVDGIPSLDADQKKNFEMGMALLKDWDRMSEAHNFMPSITPVAGGVACSLGAAEGVPIDNVNVTEGKYAGCGNYVMMNKIGNLTPPLSVSETCKKFVQVVDHLYDIFKARFSQSWVLDGEKSGSAFLTAYGVDEVKDKIAFFENCIGCHRQPVWVKGNTAGSSNDPNIDMNSNKALVAALSKAKVPDAQARLNRVFGLQSSTGTNYSVDQFKSKEQINSLIQKMMEIDMTIGVNRTNDAFFTPLSYTSGMSALSGIYAYPDKRVGGYNWIDSSSHDHASFWHTSHMQSIGSGDLATMAVMQVQHEFTPKMESLKRALEPEAGAWNGTAKRYKANAAIDDIMDELIPGSSSTEQMTYAPIGARVEGSMTSGMNNAIQVADFDRRPGPAWHEIMQGGQMAANIGHTKHISDPIKRVLAVVFLFTRPTRQGLRDMHKHNVRIPFSILLARPWMTYQMSSAVLMKGGYETGATYVGHADFQLGDDVASKIHYGNYTYYSKAVIHEPKNVIIMENIMANRYLYGNGTGWWKRDGSDLSIDKASENNRYSKRLGLISMIVPNGNEVTESPISLTGSFERDGSSGPLHYHGAAWYSNYWGFRDSMDQDDHELIGFDKSHVDHNTVCFQGHQFSWKQYSDGGGGHTAVTKNAGHWGPNVYPGCGRIRSGEGKVFHECNYNQDPM